MRIKFYWWLFLGILLASAVAPDIDHFIIDEWSITNFDCMWKGFIGHAEEFEACYTTGGTHMGREFHHPYFWAIAIGLSIGGIMRRWDTDYST